MRNGLGFLAVMVAGLSVAPLTGSAKGFESSLDPPRWADKSLAASGIEAWPGSLAGAMYTVSRHLSPNYVAADFDGDKKEDLAILIRRKTDDRFGIAIVLRAGAKKAEKAAILGAGEALGSVGADLRWMDAWSMLGQDGMSPSARKAGPKGEGLQLEKRQAAAGLVLYDGQRFVWIQHGN